MSRKRAPTKYLLCSTLALASVLCASSARAADQTGIASATVIVPITILATADLSFDRFAANTGGTVVISTAGERSATGTVALSTAASSHTAATFDIAGDTGASYAITLPGDGVVTLGDGLGNSMGVNGFASAPSGNGALAGGVQAISVGAVLSVSDAQPPGVYSGLFTITVEYN